MNENEIQANVMEFQRIMLQWFVWLEIIYFNDSMTISKFNDNRFLSFIVIDHSSHSIMSTDILTLQFIFNENNLNSFTSIDVRSQLFMFIDVLQLSLRFVDILSNSFAFIYIRVHSFTNIDIRLHSVTLIFFRPQRFPFFEFRL